MLVTYDVHPHLFFLKTQKDIGHPILALNTHKYKQKILTQAQEPFTK